MALTSAGASNLGIMSVTDRSGATPDTDNLPNRLVYDTVNNWTGSLVLLFWGYMSKPFAKKFYGSSLWRDCRQGYAAYRGHLCERCLRRGILAHGEIVHHKIELTPENVTDPNVTLNWDNLELLCRFCHAEVHDQRKKCRRYSIGPDGEIIIETPPGLDENGV